MTSAQSETSRIYEGQAGLQIALVGQGPTLHMAVSRVGAQPHRYRPDRVMHVPIISDQASAFHPALILKPQTRGVNSLIFIKVDEPNGF